MSNSDHFYRNLPVNTSFSEVLQSVHHQPVPEDWYIALTDVVDSTKAIESGKYKDVNIAGGLAAMAISNVNKGMDFPFVFGGDGMTCLIPPSIKNEVNDILFDTRKKVKLFFNLDLRIGLIPVQKLYNSGQTLSIAKLKISDYYNQAILSGSGISYAEHLIKAKKVDNPFIIQTKNKENLEADFTGFTCRWKDIPSHKGDTISTIIMLRGEKDSTLFSRILDELYKIFGKEEEFHPVYAANLKLANTEQYLGKEAQVFTSKQKGWNYLKTLWRIKFESLFTQLAMIFHLPINVNWYKLNKLKDYQIAASDFKKFDGSLKLVLNCQPEDRIRWGKFLEDLRQKEIIYYGIHVADRAIMTCLLHAGSQQEVHFIDGADGGYALAAKMMKAQIDEI